MPNGFFKAYKAYAEQGWPGLTAPEAHGGQGMGAVTLAMTSEIFSGACQSLQMLTGLVPGAIRTLLRFGTKEQQIRFIPALASGKTLTTMCLSEPGAGSDLSMVRCQAIRSGDTWKITGDKIFVSGGDQDMSEDILHLVLARTSDDGVHGLSLFLCSNKVDGSPNRDPNNSYERDSALNKSAECNRNSITVTRIENKMGLQASPTCQLAFEAAVAELIGKPGEGLRAMFTMMNHARLDVALQGVAHAARAHDVASTYAAQRLQGRAPDGSPAILSQHADVARMLDEIDARALGGRAMTHLALTTMDAGDNPDLVEFLTPIAKVYCTEAGMKAAELGMQVLGGYGYLSEYRLEQTYRDARIGAIYEGANGIHARALAERLLRGSNARTADAFDTFLASRAAGQKATGLADTLVIWREARSAVAASKTPSQLAHDFMELTADSLLHAIWTRFIEVSDQHADPARIRRLAHKQIARIRAYLPGRLSLILAAAESISVSAKKKTDV